MASNVPMTGYTESVLMHKREARRGGDNENPQSGVWWPKPAPEEMDVVLVDEKVALEAEDYVDGCGACAPKRASMTFDYLLDAVTGYDPSRTEYLMRRPAECPFCGSEITEKTFVAPRGFSRMSRQDRD